MDKIIVKDLINLSLRAKDKENAIKEMASMMESCQRLNDKEEYIRVVMEREGLSTTGIGFGVGIPHGKSNSVNIPTLAFGRSREGIEWQSLDDKPVHMVFLIGVPESSASNEHLRILALLSRKLMDENFRKNLMEIENEDELLSILGEVFKHIAA
ncbi:PTS sugar transporter subunit IIA [Anaeromicrobium sediminis]|uniref:PTS fructose transporter subunit IIA n=1 Tax=Anaeromicrobium sediminis TaxID=1478221 RepID=A0A267ME60_9FIRM|nr:fructose PTS transporter subunit IIA [Anaeromicrobium sediminis]PAB57864.1 PTS fructose transporter subunit IIA [Anaeromicrobium sediminis]